MRLLHVLLPLTALGATAVAQDPATVRGRIFDAEGTPLANVAVRVAGQEAARTTSQSDGWFTLQAVHHFDTQLEVAGKTYARQVLTIPEDGDVGDLTMVVAGHVSGWVRDAKGAPIAGATVLIGDGIDRSANWLDEQPGGRGPAFRARGVTDERGAFFVRGGVRKLASVTVEAAGFESAGPIPVDAGVPVEVSLRSRVGAKGQEEAAVVACRIRVVEAWTDKPIESFAAAAFDPHASPLQGAAQVARSLVEARDGEVSIAPPRGQHIEVRARGFARTQVVAKSGTITARLAPESTIRGIVRDPQSGEPVADVGIRALCGTTSLGALLSRAPVLTRTNDQGAFELHGLCSGRWTLVATHTQRAIGPSRSVKLGIAEPRQGVDLESPRGASLEVRIAGKAPDPRWRLRVAPQVDGPTIVTDGAFDGAKRIDGERLTWTGLLAGKHRIELLVPQPPRLGGPRRFVLRELDLADAKSQQPVDIDLEALGPRLVRGTLVGEGSVPPWSRLVVILEPRSSSPVKYPLPHFSGPVARPSPDGSFELWADSGLHTPVVVDAATRIVFYRGDDVRIPEGRPSAELEPITFRSRALEVELVREPEALGQVHHIEVRLGELWPGGVGQIRSTLREDIDSLIGIPIHGDAQALPVWIPATPVRLVPRPTTSAFPVDVPGRDHTPDAREPDAVRVQIRVL